jgi:LCP family protein required for cell wall assembly
MNTKIKMAIAGGIALIVVACAWLGIALLVKWTAPLGPHLDSAASVQETPLQQDASDPGTDQASVATVCGGPARLSLLVIGTDSRSNSYLYGLADVIRIVRLDFVEPNVSVLSLPRDLWVEVPGLEAYGITHGKLSQAYFWGTEGMGYTNNPAQGAGLLGKTLGHNFGFTADQYLVVNMRTFAKIVDAVGGIHVYVSQEIDGRYDPVTAEGDPLPPLEETAENGYFTAGSHYLDGDLALVYVRIRSGDNDFRRQERQEQVLKALRDRILSPGILTSLPELVKSFQGSVLTDLSPAQIAQLTCLAGRLGEGDLRFVAPPEQIFVGGLNADGVWALTAEDDELREGIQRFVEIGEWSGEN